METTFLRSGGDIFRALVECAAWAEKWKFCSSHGAIANASRFDDELSKHFYKLAYAIVGADFHRSDPDLLKRMHQRETLRVHVNPQNGFGPNVFLFTGGDERRIVIGGAAFDDAAFSSSFQAAVLTRCNRHAPFALAAEDFFHRCLRESHVPTWNDLEHYAQSHESIWPALDRARVVPWRRSPSDEEPDEELEGEIAPSSSEDVDDGDEHLMDDHDADSTGDEADFELDSEPEPDSTQDDGGNPRIRLDELDVAEVMIAMRNAAREGGIQPQEQLLREVARRLGYERLGKRVGQALRGHLRAAIRRRIIRRRDEDGEVCLDCRDIQAYDSETLIRAVLSVTRPGCWHERQEVVRDAARYLGFMHLRQSVDTAFRNAIRTALRRNLLVSDGDWIRRA